MTSPAVREPAHHLFVYGLVVICGLAAADFLGLPGGASVGQLMLLAGLPFWANALLARQAPLFDPNGKAAVAVILTCCTALAGLAFFSATYAAEPLRVARVVLTMLAALAMFTFLAGTLTRSRVLPLIATLAGAISVIAILTILAVLIEPFREIVFGGSADRSSGTFKNPNQFGIVISTVFPVTLGLLVAARGRLRLFAFVCLALLLVGLLFSGSKANLLLTSASATVFVLVMSTLTFKGVERTLAIFMALIGIVIMAILGILLLQAFNPRALMLITVFFSPDQSLPSLDSRRDLWDISIATFLANPWSGEGAGQFILEKIDGTVISHSHNLFIDFARTLGAPGLVFIFVLIVTVVLSLVSTVLGLFARTLSTGRKALLLGTAIGTGNYILANFSSESFGPSTSPFFWLVLFLFFLLRGESMRARNDALLTPPPKPLVLLFSDRSQKA